MSRLTRIVAVLRWPKSSPGVSLSFYFEDPEGHLIEVHWPTGVDCRPRHGDPIDLTLSEEALGRDVAELVT